jgi:nitrogen regulatory protein P-II 1
MKKVACIIQTHRVPDLLERLDGADCFFGVTESAVRGCGRQRGHLPKEEAGRRVRLRACTKLEFVVPDDRAKQLIGIISEVNTPGQRGVGDGKIFVSPVEDAMRISTGERGEKGVI